MMNTIFGKNKKPELFSPTTPGLYTSMRIIVECGRCTSFAMGYHRWQVERKMGFHTFLPILWAALLIISVFISEGFLSHDRPVENPKNGINRLSVPYANYWQSCGFTR